MSAENKTKKNKMLPVNILNDEREETPELESEYIDFIFPSGDADFFLKKLLNGMVEAANSSGALAVCSGGDPGGEYSGGGPNKCNFKYRDYSIIYFVRT